MSTFASVCAALAIILALGLAFYGAGEFTAATFGVGLIAFGCFWLIVARIAQASAHNADAAQRHAQLLAALKSGTSIEG